MHRSSDSARACRPIVICSSLCNMRAVNSVCVHAPVLSQLIACVAAPQLWHVADRCVRGWQWFKRACCWCIELLESRLQCLFRAVMRARGEEDACTLVWLVRSRLWQCGFLLCLCLSAGLELTQSTLIPPCKPLAYSAVPSTGQPGRSSLYLPAWDGSEGLNTGVALFPLYFSDI